jgi:hypothetical protein
MPLPTRVEAAAVGRAGSAVAARWEVANEHAIDITIKALVAVMATTRSVAELRR